MEERKGGKPQLSRPSFALLNPNQRDQDGGVGRNLRNKEIVSG